MSKSKAPAVPPPPPQSSSSPPANSVPVTSAPDRLLLSVVSGDVSKLGVSADVLDSVVSNSSSSNLNTVHLLKVTEEAYTMMINTTRLEDSAPQNVKEGKSDGAASSSPSRGASPVSPKQSNISSPVSPRPKSTFGRKVGGPDPEKTPASEPPPALKKKKVLARDIQITPFNLSEGDHGENGRIVVTATPSVTMGGAAPCLGVLESMITAKGVSEVKVKEVFQALRHLPQPFYATFVVYKEGRLKIEIPFCYKGVVTEGLVGLFERLVGAESPLVVAFSKVVSGLSGLSANSESAFLPRVADVEGVCNQLLAALSSGETQNEKLSEHLEKFVAANTAIPLSTKSLPKSPPESDLGSSVTSISLKSPLSTKLSSPGGRGGGAGSVAGTPHSSVGGPSGLDGNADGMALLHETLEALLQTAVLSGFEAILNSFLNDGNTPLLDPIYTIYYIPQYSLPVAKSLCEANSRLIAECASRVVIGLWKERSIAAMKKKFAAEGMILASELSGKDGGNIIGGSAKPKEPTVPPTLQHQLFRVGGATTTQSPRRFGAAPSNTPTGNGVLHDFLTNLSTTSFCANLKKITAAPPLKVTTLSKPSRGPPITPRESTSEKEEKETTSLLLHIDGAEVLVVKGMCEVLNGGSVVKSVEKTKDPPQGGPFGGRGGGGKADTSKSASLHTHLLTAFQSEAFSPEVRSILPTTVSSLCSAKVLKFLNDIAESSPSPPFSSERILCITSQSETNGVSSTFSSIHEAQNGGYEECKPFSYFREFRPLLWEGAGEEKCRRKKKRQSIDSSSTNNPANRRRSMAGDAFSSPKTYLSKTHSAKDEEESSPFRLPDRASRKSISLAVPIKKEVVINQGAIKKMFQEANIDAKLYQIGSSSAVFGSDVIKLLQSLLEERKIELNSLLRLELRCKEAKRIVLGKRITPIQRWWRGVMESIRIFREHLKEQSEHLIAEHSLDTKLLEGEQRAEAGQLYADFLAPLPAMRKAGLLLLERDEMQARIYTYDEEVDEATMLFHTFAGQLSTITHQVRGRTVIREQTRIAVSVALNDHEGGARFRLAHEESVARDALSRFHAIATKAYTRNIKRRAKEVEAMRREKELQLIMQAEATPLSAGAWGVRVGGGGGGVSPMRAVMGGLGSPYSPERESATAPPLPMHRLVRSSY